MKKFMFLFLCTVFVLSGCNSNKEDTNTLATTKPEAVEPESNTNIVGENIIFSGSSTLAPVISAIDAKYQEVSNMETKIDVLPGGSGQGSKAVIDKTANFGLLARTVKDSEREQIENPVEYLVGIDALTISVNPENPIAQIKDNFTKDEIIKIFSGEYKTWKDIDATLAEDEIIVVTRDIGGGAHEVFQTNIMGEVEVKEDAIQAPSMGALVTKIGENKNAIGYASFGVANQNPDKVFVLKVDEVEPTKENIQNGSYIIQRPLIILGSGTNTEQEQSFIDYILGAEGQTIVEELGFISAK